MTIAKPRRLFGTGVSHDLIVPAKFFRHLLCAFAISILSTCLALADEVKTKTPYYGKRIGDFPEQGLRDHYLAGTVYSVNSHTFFVHKQNYDGKAPMAYFWIGKTADPDVNGQPIRWPNYGPAYFSTVKNTKPLPRAFAYENVLVEMPAFENLTNYRYLSMWCDYVHRSFGHVTIPPNFRPPKPLILDSELQGSEAGISSGVIHLLDSKTILIKEFNFNGAGTGAGFYVGTGSIQVGPGNGGDPSKFTRVPDEYGITEGELKSYGGQDLTLTLPADVDLMNVDWLSLYSSKSKSHLAFVRIPKDLDIPPNLNSIAIGYAAGHTFTAVFGPLPAVLFAALVTYFGIFRTTDIL